ncbi:MAG: CDP-alcohol phosphatidyltransferase family protein [Rhodothermales bacterium]|nr:CDP-alcohol phosphatidyltransferase family protein [Rhodothermales bacterium]MCA0269526.1 CDP-alcohol phosphatidyltransferase family protein [Bacteroidota bacterium]
MKHLPNTLTVLRIVLTPLVLVGVAKDTPGWLFTATVAFIVAALSDYYDGHLARRYGSHSRFGQFLDPLADKILVLGTLAILAWKHPSLAPWWAVAVIALRDLGVTLARSRAERAGHSLKTLGMAKTKTALQFTYLIATLVFLTARAFGGPLGDLAGWILDTPLMPTMLVVLAALTVYTGLPYLFKPQYSDAG